MRLTDQMIVERVRDLIKKHKTTFGAGKAINADIATIRSMSEGRVDHIRLEMLDKLGMDYGHALLKLKPEELGREIKLIYGNFAEASRKTGIPAPTLTKLARGVRVSKYFTLIRIFDAIDGGTDTEVVHEKKPTVYVINPHVIKPWTSAKNSGAYYGGAI